MNRLVRKKIAWHRRGWFQIASTQLPDTGVHSRSAECGSDSRSLRSHVMRVSVRLRNARCLRAGSIMRRNSCSLACLVVALTLGCTRKTSERTWIVVSNEDSGDVTIIDPVLDSVVRTISVGKRPRGMRASPDGQRLYVALSGSEKGRDGKEKASRDESADGIGVVDLERGVLVRTIGSGRDPEAFDLTADGKHLYVSNEETSEVSVIDVDSGNVERRIHVGAEPEGVSISPDGVHVYVTSEAENAVDVVRTSDNTIVGRIATAERPRAVVLSPDGEHVFVTAELGGALQIVNSRSRARVGTIRTGDGARPMGIALDPDGIRAYVSNGREGSVAVVDLPSRAVVRSIPKVGARPWGVGLLPDGKKLYVAAGPDVAVVDTARGEVVKRVAAGRGPWGVLVVRRTSR